MNFASVREAATFYISKGWQVVPLERGKKHPKQDDWLAIIFQPDDFRPTDNIGLRSVNGMVIVDVDAPEAVQLADAFLPETGCVYGRPGKPRAKRLYLSSFPKTISYRDENNNELVAVHTEHQDVAPPSVWTHKDEPSITEVLQWSGVIGEVSTVDSLVLIKSVRLLCTAALIGRHYAPPGGRHDWSLSLAGYLRYLGLTAEECIKCVQFAGNVAGDSKIEDRLTEIRTTYAKGDDDPVKGAKSLNEIQGSKNLTQALAKIWGSSSSAFILNEKGDKVAANNQENIRRAFEKLEVELTYDTFSQKPLIKYNDYSGPLQDEIRNRLWLDIDRKFHFRPNADFFDVVLNDTARQKEFHPVRNYLQKLEWDGVERLESWLIRLGRAADTPYVKAVSSLVLIAAVKRVMHPGCKFDELMVLESGQGQLKSSALRVLCPHDDWFSDDLPLNVDSKQIIERTLGKWIIEAGELSGMPKSQTEHLKSMLSRQVDGPVRMAYGRLPVERPRQFIIVGTTNSHHYLKDGTGNRRFWPVRVERFSIEEIFKERDQLWAEAYKKEREGASVRLMPALFEHASIQQERRRTADPWELHLLQIFPIDKQHRVVPSEIWDKLGVPLAQRDERGNERIHAIMQRLGFRRMSVRRDHAVIPGWGRDAQQPSLEPEAEAV